MPIAMKRPVVFLFALLLISIGVASVWDAMRSPHASSPPANTYAASSSSEETAPPAVMPVNAVIGDLSYWTRFGRWPGPEADEDTRIRTHLAYVERLLRSRPTAHLSPAQRTARTRHLDRLHTYWTRGVFPRNDRFPDRRQPTFIDSAGRICAVGYLIEQSAGRAVAERINARYKYAYLHTIEMPLLEDWIAQSGLTKHELAMIQPAYCGDLGDRACWPYGNEDTDTIRPGVEIGLALLNGGTAALNGVLRLNGRSSYVSSGAGLALGTTGLAVSLSDRSNYPTASLVFAGASLLASTINLTGTLTRRSEARHAALVPATHVAVVPARDRPPTMRLSLQWAF
jgi:hypothetical protein